MEIIEFTKDELTEIYYSAVDALESTYFGDFDEDLDVAREPADRFLGLSPEKVALLQGLILKLDPVINAKTEAA